MEKKKKNSLREEIEVQQKEIMLRLESVKERKYFIRGLTLGLFYGIIGNIVVSHYYGLFDSLIRNDFNALFWANLTVFIIGILAILVVSWKWYKELKLLDFIQEIIEDFRVYSKGIMKKIKKLEKQNG